MRIGIYMDFVYSADASGVSTDQAVVLFALELAPRIGEVALIGRLAPEPGRAPYPVGGPHVRFVALPHYPTLTDLAPLLRAIRRSCAVFAAELDALDAVWLFTPSPLSLLFAAIARRRGVPVIFGLRQDTPQYLAHRLPSRRWIWVLPLAHAVDRVHRVLAWRVPTTVVGRDLARKFDAGRKRVLEMSVSLVRRADLVTVESARAKPWDGELRLLSVGRIDPEKNPLLLADVLAELRSRDPRWRLDVAGDGPLAEALRRRAVELGVAGALELHGYVPNGPQLQQLYRRAHALVHVSLTEGLPQVLYEAHAAGLPIVATDVGGVRGALAAGRAGLLVPPRDARAAAAALERLRDDPALRARLVEAGLGSVELQTIERQLDSVTAFIVEHVAPRSARARVRRRPRARRAAAGRSRALIYHDVREHPGEDPGGWQGPVAERYKIDLASFEEHLDAIAATGAEVGLLGADGDGPDVALTFDDGGSSALLAASALERRGWRGHFFLTTSRIGTAGFLAPDGVRALAERGHLVGSHSHTHPMYMGRLPESEILEEWQRSRDVLAAALGEPPSFASLPGGWQSATVVRAAARAGYRLLLTSEPGAPIGHLGELTVVGRYPIHAGTPARRVAGYASGGPLACGGARLEWQAKTAAKRLAPTLYRIVTRAPAVRPSREGS
ncbi:MAG TPA: glycosyltransferase [Solirubrobacteraceae bacterium]|nr:glycosyltransferase [Solirubrobacteraceae bacterium]